MTTPKIKILFLSLFFVFTNLLFVNLSFATDYGCITSTGELEGDKLTSCANVACVNGSCKEIPASTQKTVTLPNPLGDVKDARVLVGKIISALLGVVGSLALLMFIAGGLTWMTAAGNAERVKKGKDIIVWATIGLVVIFTSYALVQFVLKAVGAL